MHSTRQLPDLNRWLYRILTSSISAWLLLIRWLLVFSCVIHCIKTIHKVSFLILHGIVSISLLHFLLSKWLFGSCGEASYLVAQLEMSAFIHLSYLILLMTSIRVHTISPHIHLIISTPSLVLCDVPSEIGISYLGGLFLTRILLTNHTLFAFISQY